MATKNIHDLRLLIEIYIGGVDREYSHFRCRDTVACPMPRALAIAVCVIPLALIAITCSRTSLDALCFSVAVGISNMGRILFMARSLMPKWFWTVVRSWAMVPALT